MATMKTLSPKAFLSQPEFPFLKAPGTPEFFGKRWTTQDPYCSATGHSWSQQRCWVHHSRASLKDQQVNHSSYQLLKNCFCSLKNNNATRVKDHAEPFLFAIRVSSQWVTGPFQRTEIKPITFAHSLLSGWMWKSRLQAANELQTPGRDVPGPHWLTQCRTGSSPGTVYADHFCRNWLRVLLPLPITWIQSQILLPKPVPLGSISIRGHWTVSDTFHSTRLGI